jgi:hypothetical protein
MRKLRQRKNPRKINKISRGGGFSFNAQGKCKGNATCKRSEFTREVKVIAN